MSGFGQNPPGTSAFSFPSLNQQGAANAAPGFTFGTPKTAAVPGAPTFGSTPSFGLTGAVASTSLPQSTNAENLFGTTFGTFSAGSNVTAASTPSAAPNLAPAAGALAKSSPFTFGTPASSAATQLPTSTVAGLTAGAPTLGVAPTLGTPSSLGAPTSLGVTPTLGAATTLGANLGVTSTYGATPTLGGAPTLGSTSTLGATLSTATTLGATLGTTPSLGTTLGATPTLGTLGAGMAPGVAAPALNFSFGSQAVTTTSSAPSAGLSIPTLGAASAPKPQMMPTMPSTAPTSTPAPALSTPAVSSSIKFPTTAPQSTAPKTTTFATGMTMFSTSSTSAPTATSTTVIATSTPATSTAAATSTVSGSTSEEDVMTYSKLQENINKWALELEKQEKLFLHQATEMNGWDRVIVENSEKLHMLNGKIEKVRREQRYLDLELDFVLSQQNELDYMLKGLEKEWGSVPPLDPERQHTYKIAESLDYKLKVMSDDLKEVVDHMNAMNYPPNDEFNPVMQIVRILNAHMNVLLMVERKTNLAETKAKEVGKLLELCKRDCDRACHLYFD